MNQFTESLIQSMLSSKQSVEHQDYANQHPRENKTPDESKPKAGHQIQLERLEHKIESVIRNPLAISSKKRYLGEIVRKDQNQIYSLDNDHQLNLISQSNKVTQ